MDAASAHRKIELQASEDLAYLVANVRRAAAARIDEAFPPVDGDDESGAQGEDELRTRIEAFVNEVCIFLKVFYLFILILPILFILKKPRIMQALFSFSMFFIPSYVFLTECFGWPVGRCTKQASNSASGSGGGKPTKTEQLRKTSKGVGGEI